MKHSFGHCSCFTSGVVATTLIGHFLGVLVIVHTAPIQDIQLSYGTIAGVWYKSVPYCVTLASLGLCTTSCLLTFMSWLTSGITFCQPDSFNGFNILFPAVCTHCYFSASMHVCTYRDAALLRHVSCAILRLTMVVQLQNSFHFKVTKLQNL